ncbi:three-helix bundle dimerization domain-containing protein [Streptomyces sp. NPDC001219]
MKEAIQAVAERLTDAYITTRTPEEIEAAVTEARDAGECGLGPGTMGRPRGGQRGRGGIGRSGGLEDEVGDRFGVGDHGYVGGVDLHGV